MDWKNLLLSFEGRVGRKTYWLTLLAMVVIVGALEVVALGPMIAAAKGGDPAAMQNFSIPIWFWILMLPAIWIGLAIQAKRWHDVDKSAWWILIGLVPLVGGIIALVFNGFIAGTPGANRFGNPPA